MDPSEHPVESLPLDLRHVARALVRRPAFTALSVATLAIGIGVNVIAFAAVNALIFKSLDIPDASSASSRTSRTATLTSAKGSHLSSAYRSGLQRIDRAGRPILWRSVRPPASGHGRAGGLLIPAWRATRTDPITALRHD